MNKMNFTGEELQNLQQNQNSYPSQPHSKAKKPKSSSNQLELHVASTYQDIFQLISQKTDQITLPQEVSTAAERINLLKTLIEFLLDNSLQSNQGPKQQKKENDDQIQCNQCASYQANLQKLENQVRQHIRTQQQLKLYTDNIEEKLQDAKKDKKDIDKKVESQKRQIQEMKNFSSTNIERMNKLELQNEKLKNQIKSAKTTTRGDQTRRTKGGVQNKENRIDWGHRNVSIKKEQKTETRRSIQKRQQSNQKFRTSVNTRSTKGFPMAEKLIQEKNRQERKKILQGKFEYRR